jgi:hypothetical protein
MTGEVRLLLIDKKNLRRVSDTDLDLLVPNALPTDVIVVIVLGVEGGLVLPGVPMSDVPAAQPLRLVSFPKRNQRDIDLVLSTIYDVLAVYSAESVTIRVHSLVNWAEFTELHAELRQFGGVTGLPPLPEPLFNLVIDAIILFVFCLVALVVAGSPPLSPLRWMVDWETRG